MRASPSQVRLGVERLSNLGIDGAVLFLTATGRKKSIIDATAAVRSFLHRASLHDYRAQSQGKAHRVHIDAHIVTREAVLPAKASLYRPKTKKGDPRIWISRLGHYVGDNTVLCLVTFGRELYIVDAQDGPLWRYGSDASTPVGMLALAIKTESDSIADELLERLRELAGRSHKTVRAGDTGVGATLEALLGIPSNSSRLPDYKGIELKAGRLTKVRQTLFAQVPDWDLSQLKSSLEIARSYGYDKEGSWQLNCTVSSKSINRQGLFLVMDPEADLLRERHSNAHDRRMPAATYDEVAVWRLEVLRMRLAEKHKETFWISARSEGVGSNEMFTFISVRHTRSPKVGLFHTLLDSGLVTVDHLIKKHERGPFFKIGKSNIHLLFPPPIQHELQEIRE